MLKDLIMQSLVIKPEEKSVYLRLLEFLGDDQKKDFEKILQEEAEELKKIREDKNKAEAVLHNKYSEDLKSLFIREQSKAMSKEEEVERAGADDLLDQLNSL